MTSILRVLRNLALGRPILAIYDLTKLCNQRCPMCNIWKTKSESMELAAIKVRAAALARFGIGYVFLQGGEPTLRKDLIDITDIFLAEHIKPTVITNGILFKRELAEQIASRPVNLAISIDSLNPELFTRLRGRPSLPKVLENIEAIQDLKRKGNWAITTTVSALSDPEDIFALRDYALSHGFMHAIRPYVFVSGTAGADVPEMSADRQKVIAIYERYLELARQENYLASLIYKRHLSYLRGEPQPPCDAFCRSLLMKETGVLAPCIEFPEQEVFLDRPFKAQYRALMPIFARCNHDHPCFYNDAREIGILWQRKWQILGHLPLILRQTRRYGSFF